METTRSFAGCFLRGVCLDGSRYACGEGTKGEAQRVREIAELAAVPRPSILCVRTRDAPPILARRKVVAPLTDARRSTTSTVPRPCHTQGPPGSCGQQRTKACAFARRPLISFVAMVTQPVVQASWHQYRRKSRWFNPDWVPVTPVSVSALFASPRSTATPDGYTPLHRIDRGGTRRASDARGSIPKLLHPVGSSNASLRVRDETAQKPGRCNPPVRKHRFPTGSRRNSGVGGPDHRYLDQVMCWLIVGSPSSLLGCHRVTQ